jgi:DnaJ-domain-containing protein 1
MSYVLLGGLAFLICLGVYQATGGLTPVGRAKFMRWGLGGILGVITLFLAFARRLDLATFTAAAAYSIVRYGRLGPFKLGGESLNPGNISKVRSRFLAMKLDHESGTVMGRVVAGQFSGSDLIDLDEMQVRALIVEIGADPDSTSLLETWLDANRSGWREYFEEAAGAQTTGAASGRPNAEEEAYAILGLQPGASVDEIQRAHRELMKSLHPDHGGSSYLASKINEARDVLLKSRSS